MFFGIEKKYAVLDCTGFDKDGITTLLMSMVTGHGRGTQILWNAVE